MESKLLEFKNLVTEFNTDAGNVKAVDNVSFTLNKGETIGVAVSYTHLTLPTICSV